VIELAYYVRKISPAKWPQKGQNLCVEQYRADAITGDLRTTEDTLSLWMIDNLDELENAVLALASGNDKIVTHNVLAIPEEKIEEYGFKLIETKGDTPVDILAHNHRDISEITYKDLGLFAELIADSINSNGLHTVTRKRVKLLIINAFKDGKINKNKLKERMLNEIEAELSK